jgi:uncharacterized protein GlcG (DUF336 family)
MPDDLQPADQALLKEKPMLTLAAAKKVISAAEAEALKQGFPVVIAVVDDGGNLLCLQRLDNAQFGSVDIAIGKAKAAVAFKRPTKAWEDLLAAGQQRVLRLPGVLPSEGGVPLTWKGHIVGAIGVSGVQAFQDGQIARAGKAALLDRSEYVEFPSPDLPLVHNPVFMLDRRHTPRFTTR